MDANQRELERGQKSIVTVLCERRCQWEEVYRRDARLRKATPVQAEAAKGRGEEREEVGVSVGQ